MLWLTEKMASYAKTYLSVLGSTTDRLKIGLIFQEEKFMLLKIILAIVLPPLSVFLSTGVGTALIINIVLTFIGWLPGTIHALWILNKQSERSNL